MPISGVPGYNPQAYVPGGSSPAVSRAIQRLGAKKSPMYAALGGYDPQAYVPGGSSPAVSQAIQSRGWAGMPQVTIPQSSATVQPRQPSEPDTGSDTSNDSAVSKNTSTTGLSGLDEYMNEAQTDPAYIAAEDTYRNAINMGEPSVFGDPVKQLLMQYGYVPNDADISGLSPGTQALVHKYFDPTTTAAASWNLGAPPGQQGNIYSTAAQIARAYNQGAASIAPTFAEVGLGGGGMQIAADELRYQRGLQDKATLDQLLGGIRTAGQNWVDYQNQAANARNTAEAAVYQRLAQIAGYHAMLDAAGKEVQTPDEPPPAPTFGTVFADTPYGENAYGPNTYVDPRYSGGPEAVFLPDPETAQLMATDAAAGQWDDWAAAMANLGSTSPQTAPTISAPTKKVLARIKGGAPTGPFGAKLGALG